VIVLVLTLNGEWRWYAGKGSGVRQDVRQAFEDAAFAHLQATTEPKYGKCVGDDAPIPCWCGRPGHVEVNVTIGPDGKIR
jgi:hypothetical protein